MAGVLGSIVTVWATFAPCFLWIFLGAPFVERIRGHRRLGAALGAVTAAVVGVIASLALTFGVNVLFDGVFYREPFLIPIPLPRLGTVDPWALADRGGGVRRAPAVQAEPRARRRGCGVVGLVHALVA